MKFLLKNAEIETYNESTAFVFPKYTSQLINLANQNAQGTRPAVVGQMSELFQEFMATGEEITIENWRNWYIERHPDAINNATDRIFAQVQNLKGAIDLVDRDLIKQWVEDLVFFKTFNGLYVQKAILASLAERTGTTYRLATPDEEAQGIDGFVGDNPYSIKPVTYKTMERLPESIENVKMIFYEKTKTGLRVEIED